MSKGNHSSNAKAALVVLADPQISTAVDISKLQAVALQQIEQITAMEREAGLRAILCGFALHRVKAALKHGQFLPWLKANLKGAGKSQANNYMRLAAIVVEKVRLTKPELLALPGDQAEFSLDTLEGDARRFMGKLTKFVGEKSLNELLRDHGIKESGKLGGKRNAVADTSDAAGDDDDPEILAQAAREQISGWFADGRQLLIDEGLPRHLTPADRATVAGQLAAFTTEVRQALGLKH